MGLGPLCQEHAKARRWGRGQGLFSIQNVGLLCFGLRGSSYQIGGLFLCVEVVSTIPFASSQSQMKSELAAVASEFGRLTRFLAEEQAGLERRRREMHEAQLGRAGAAASRLSEQAAQLSRLLAEAQERSQQGGLRLLQVSNGPFLVHPPEPCVCCNRWCLPNTCPELPLFSLGGTHSDLTRIFEAGDRLVDTECGV